MKSSPGRERADRPRTTVGRAPGFLDDDGRQLPILIPHDVPDAPSRAARRQFGPFLAGLVDELDASAVVGVLERPGPDALRSGDRAWCAVRAEACRVARVPLRGPVLAHDDGFRWIATEDFLVGAE